MHRLSIIIPCRVFNQSAEDTLVSVLQNRPANSEVIVVTAGKYDDPYDLANEVKFVEEVATASTTQLVNRGFEVASAEIVHLLSPGVQALDQWTETVLDHFADPQVATVSPALVANATDKRAVSLGIDYWVCGSRRVLGKGAKLSDPRLTQMKILGPGYEAGFYRRSAVSAVGGFDELMDLANADVEMGLAFRQLGLQAIVEPGSTLVRGKVHLPVSAFQNARQSERLFRRYSNASVGVAMLHALLVGIDVIGTFPRPQMLMKACGRIAAWFESRVQERQQERVHRAQAYLTQVAVSQSPTSIRGDFSKARNKPSAANCQSRRRAA